MFPLLRQYKIPGFFQGRNYKFPVETVTFYAVIFFGLKCLRCGAIRNFEETKCQVLTNFLKNIYHYVIARKFGCKSVGAALHILVHQRGSTSEIFARWTNPGAKLPKIKKNRRKKTNICCYSCLTSRRIVQCAENSVVNKCLNVENNLPVVF